MLDPMDLIRLLRSLEEFLYELVGWLVFYPRTLWRVLVRPGEVAQYTRREFAKDEEHRFADAISPVLMLILSVVIAHGLEMAVRTPTLAIQGPVGKLLFGSEQGILLTRSAIFCMFALGAALGTLWRQKLPVNRDTLREPFSIQAFIACPFVILLSISGAAGVKGQVGLSFLDPLITVVAVAWYLWARSRTVVALYGGGYWAAFGYVFTSFALTLALVVALILAIAL
ncbi:hypothetical protein JAK51_03810 [Stenotrophomonas maltophilia]|uniref:hypothetical protein n=1 Tax=Stenotrophomonas maltophilia TaxID=40324 RepID=UPI0021C98F91|nr:hypothetical protein [Stenotrophomonas maltophilia]MCU1125366.1 hypothetical protein [Stenotrophomonas maltophilia]